MNDGENLLIPGALVQMFEQASLNTIWIALFGGMILAAAIGLTIRRAPSLILPSKDEDGQEAYVVSAVLGLLALLMGFTFSLALSRYEDRRELVLGEANAIGTTYLRAQLLNEPDRSEVSSILVEYASTRLELAQVSGDRVEDLLARSDALLVRLWAETKQVPVNSGSTPITSLFVASVNEVIDLDAARKNARAAKVPSAVYAVLMIYILISAAILGYSLVGFWARLAAIVLFLLLNLSMILIVDIDRPLVGMLREQQKPMEDLVAYFQTAPPERFDLPAAN
jgi:hypothetical protein